MIEYAENIRGWDFKVDFFFASPFYPTFKKTTKNKTCATYTPDPILLKHRKTLYTYDRK